MATSTGRDLSDPSFRASVIELCGALAYGELVGFFMIVHDAETAPRVGDRIALARLAAHELEQYERLAGRIEELGADPEVAMQPFAESFDDWHRRTPPSSWLEGLMKVYAGHALAEDFYREISAYVDADTRALVVEVMQEGGHVEFARQTLREAIANDPAAGGRLALFGRRLIGEALSQAQRVAAERDAITALLVDDGSGHGADLAELTQIFARLTQAHTDRMESLGLSA
ncbi:ferritin-like fold-containing protein [Luteipulveratus sp. YIM 133132]|uniref:Ferritin-like fold-containing protein n=1 Tax=Luteipulveratus flavus TaxID=3031728 RepID=A0ABT6C7V5_9MICO|nr:MULTISPECIES: ferritin-like fold-containing protein [unclassified Luteipulveratus]MDE9365831.1 ferritin-like fold-containing protein [Luteipulveratus sp. YIM 133132]MDF8265021.1 ferritin-like fold-containing protein [Luteipulveratus sp. YIM 133296]